MRAVSVGFKPIDTPTFNTEGGLDYKSVELLEISAVPVPANREALVGTKSVASDVSEARTRQLIERAVDVGEASTLIRQLDRLDDGALMALVALL
jgi:phage head maturation protease